MSTWAQFPVRAPMDVGQILNRVFQLVRANLKVLVGIASVPPLVIYGLLGVTGAAICIPIFSRLHQAPSPQQISQALLVFVPLIILIFVLYWLVFGLYLAAGCHAAIQVDHGAAVSFGDAYAVAWSRAGRYVLLLLIIYAICFFPALLIQLAMAGTMGLSILHKSQPNPLLFVFLPFAVFLQMALLVAGFVIALRFSLAFPASVAENLGAVDALKRSDALTRGAKLKIFLVMLVIYAATYVATLILMCGIFFVLAIGLFLFSGAHFDFASPVVVILGVIAGLGFLALMTLFMACSWAGYSTGLCVIYNDQRRLFGPGAPA